MQVDWASKKVKTVARRNDRGEPMVHELLAISLLCDEYERAIRIVKRIGRKSQAHHKACQEILRSLTRGRTGPRQAVDYTQPNRITKADIVWAKRVLKINHTE